MLGAVKKYCQYLLPLRIFKVVQKLQFFLWGGGRGLSFDILRTREHSISETGSSSVLRANLDIMEKENF
jgi:hypothetical protein